MNKKQLVSNIIELSKIHHNIKINFSKMPDYTEDDVENGFDWTIEAEILLESFCDNFMYKKISDSGNRNLCDCKDKTKDSVCKIHDLYHCYTHGRMGATLYFDKYWKGLNSRGVYFIYEEYELEEMPITELKTIYKEMSYFNDKIKYLMEDFYSQCKYRLKEIREEKVLEEKQEKEYQETKKKVVDNKYIKRLVSEII